MGQAHLLAPGKLLTSAIEKDRVPSMILWGPPGVGKTTLARIIAQHTRAEFVQFSGVLSSIKEIKQVMAGAEKMHRAGRRKNQIWTLAPELSRLASKLCSARKRSTGPPRAAAQGTGKNGQP